MFASSSYNIGNPPDSCKPPTAMHHHGVARVEPAAKRILLKRFRLNSAVSPLINEDLVPSPQHRRTWGPWAFFTYWWSESWAVSTWTCGSSMIGIGLKVRDSLLIVLLANCLAALVIVLNGRAAAKYHIGFPVLARATFGMHFHYFIVAVRAALGVIWGGVQLYFEGQFIGLMIRCVFGNVKNTIPSSQYITTRDAIGYAVAFLVTLPFMLIPTWKIRPLFAVKSALMPATGLAVVIWACTINRGVGGASRLDSVRPASTTAFAFSVLGAFNSVMGATSALIVTTPDLTRYARRPQDQHWQLVALPAAQTLAAGFGIITTSAINNAWGVTLWNPKDLFDQVLDHYYSPGARAAVFFISLSFAFATLCTSIACNIVPFAADVTCLLPKYLTIVRGQFLCLFLAAFTFPWRIVSSATGFLAFLGGYSIFQGSIVAMMIADYYVIRKGNLDIPQLYSRSAEGKYYFFHGVNLRAVAGFVAGFAAPLAGLVQTVRGRTEPVGTLRLFDLGWLLSFFVGGLAYLFLCWVWGKPFAQDRASSWEEEGEAEVEFMAEIVPASPAASLTAVETEGDRPIDASPKAEGNHAGMDGRSPFMTGTDPSFSAQRERAG